MKPITFQCQATLSLSPQKIADEILTMEKWPTFQGYAFLPGIRAAEFETRTSEIVGSRIRVTNTDGSTHIETIETWDLPTTLSMRLQEFSPPLSRLAESIEETWFFTIENEKTQCMREMKIHPKSFFGRCILWLISFFLKAAIARHLREMNRG